VLLHFLERTLHVLLDGTDRGRARNRVWSLALQCIQAQGVEVDVNDRPATGSLLRQPHIWEPTVNEQEVSENY
jgi:hypothetical protein